MEYKIGPLVTSKIILGVRDNTIEVGEESITYKGETINDVHELCNALRKFLSNPHSN